MTGTPEQDSSAPLIGALRVVDAAGSLPAGLLEAPRFDRDRWLFTDITLGGVWALAADDRVTSLLAGRRGVGGLVLHEDGIVVAGRTLLHVRADGTQTVLLDDPEATGVNDLHVLPDGSIVAGLLRFRPMAAEAPVPGRIVRFLPDGEVRTLDETILWPNGIGHSPSGDLLYVSDYAAQRVLALPVDGGPADVFCTIEDGAPDGLAVDEAGGVWVALAGGGAIARFTPDGRRACTVPMPAGFISSIGFGGDDGRDVLVTGMGNDGGVVLRARSAVAGLPSVRATVVGTC